MSFRIESWEGKNEIWYAKSYIHGGGEYDTIPVMGRGGTREEAIAEVEGRIAERLSFYQRTAESKEIHEVEIIPEGAGVRVSETEEGDDSA